MPESAEAVSATLTTNRNCTIEITNVSSVFCLVNPKVHMVSGFNRHSPQPTVRNAKTEVCSFTKDDHTATGSVGLLTYDLFHMHRRSLFKRLAIMFSVPFDRNLYKNCLALGLVELSRGCDHSLYEQMCEGAVESNFVRSDGDGNGLEHLTSEVELRASMSSVGKAIVKLEIYDKMH